MILCVDIGNTSIKIARVGATRMGRVEVVPSTATERALARAMARVATHPVDGAAIASVRPAATAAVRRVIRRELGIDARVVTYRTRLPIQVATRRPARVGIDRLCAASGAVGQRGRSAIVVDAGTAITVDLVLDRRFAGGLIIPGPQMMLSALHHFTAQLPDLDLDKKATFAINDTAPAMQTGATVGAAGAILSAVWLLRQRAGRPVPVWLTGGHMPRLEAVLPAGWKRDPYLTLRGLFTIADQNRSGR